MGKTIIEELVVELGLDDSKLVSKEKELDRRQARTREQMRKGGNEIESGVKRQTNAFGGLRRELVGILALFTAGAGLKQFIQSTVTSDAAVGRLSKQIGVSTERLSTWQGVLSRNGGTAAGATAALSTMTSAYQEFISTGRVSLPYLQQLGSLGFRLDDLKDPEQALLKLADIFQKLEPERAAFIGRSFGFDEATIALLTQGREALEASLEEQEKIGVVSDENAKAAQRLQRSWGALMQRSADLGRQLLLYAEPALKRVTEWIQKLAEWAQRHRAAVTGFFWGIVGALTAIGVAALVAYWPIALLIGVLALLGGAFGELVEQNPEIKEALGELGSAFSDLFQQLADFGRYIQESPFGKWLADQLRPGGPAVQLLKGLIRGLATDVRILGAVLKGDWAAIPRIEREYLEKQGAERLRQREAEDAAARAYDAPSRAPRSSARVPGRGSTAERSAGLLRGFEGFRQGAYWDKNAWRVGYGSDTTTDPKTGRVTRVTSATRVSKDQAEADLKRRIEKEFLPKVMRQIGSRWGQLEEDAKAALVSVAYNYGALPSSVVQAAQKGDSLAIANAVRALRGHNEGVNAGRRDSEAAIIAGAANSNTPGRFAANPGAGFQPAANRTGLSTRPTPASSTSNRSEVNIDKIEVHTQATDAAGIARDIGPAIQQRMYATQANRGLA